MILNRFLIPILLVYPILSLAQDPWPKAAKLMSKMVKRPDPIKDQPPEFAGSNDISFSVPIDYYPEIEEQKYAKFWEEKATDLQLKLYNLLEESSTIYNNINATYTLAQMHLYQQYDVPHNKTLAYQYLDKYNNLTKHTNPETLFQEGVMHATGLFGTIPINSGRSILFYQRAARLGSLQAKQALAYKYSNGLNVPRDFNRALILYRELAEILKLKYTDAEWNIVFPDIETFNLRLPDFEGGLLGEGINSISLSITRRKSAKPGITSTMLTKIVAGEPVLNFNNIDSPNAFSIDEEDDNDEQLIDIYYTAWDEYKGTFTKTRDVNNARILLEATYNEYDKDVGYLDTLQRFFYGKCLHLLGHIYLTGEGLDRPNILLAEKYLKRSVLVTESGSTIQSSANVDLGLIYQYYYYNDTKAIEYYTKGIKKDAGGGVAEYQLSKLSESNPDLNLEHPDNLIHIACMKGYLPAKYDRSKRYEEGNDANNMYNTEMSAFDFKSFVEDNEPIMAPQLRVAFNELLMGNAEVALWAYVQAAEQGYEMAQISTAYLLYQLPYNLDDPPITSNERKLLAITYYTRAFKQNNIDAGVVAGDVYYNMGNYEQAFSIYQNAALKFSSQAIWNLGYMYEYGLGIPKDFHLAKRYYDQVLEKDNNLYLAVKLSVIKLKFKSFFIWLVNDSPYPTLIINRFKSRFHCLLKDARSKLYGLKIWNLFKTNQVPEGFRLPHKTVVESGFDRANALNNDESSSILDALGLFPEDIFTLLFIVVLFFGFYFLRNVALRRGWNIQINGVQIGQQEHQQNDNNDNVAPPQAGGFNVEFFAI